MSKGKTVPRDGEDASVGNHAKRVIVGCALDDTCCFYNVRLGPKTSVYHTKVIVVSTTSGCDVTLCNNITRVQQAEEVKHHSLSSSEEITALQVTVGKE